MVQGSPHRGVGRSLGTVEESEELLRTVFKQATVGFSLTAPDGRLLLVNEALARMVGRTCDELIGCNFADITHPDDLAASHECIRCLLAGERDTYRFEKRYRHAQGGYIWALVTTTLYRAQDGSPLYFITNVQDIGDLKRTEEALRESEERFRQIAGSMADLAFSCVRGPGKDYVIDWMVGDTESVLGYTVRELIEEVTCWGRLVVEDDRPAFEQAVTGLAPGEEGSVELRVRRKDGGIVWLVSHARCLADADGSTRLYGALVDVTETKRRERERAVFADALAASLNEIYLFDAETLRFREVNRGALQNLGYPPHLIRQMTPLDIKPEFTAESFAELIRPLLAGEKAVQVFETVHLRADGSTYPVEVHLQLVEHDSDRLFLAVIQDITDRRRAQAQVARNEAGLRSLLRILQHEAESAHDLLEFAMEEAIGITGSKYGFILLADEGERGFTPATWSKEVMAECRALTPPTRYRLEDMGLWGEPVRQRGPVVFNDMAEPHPRAKGYPDGHVPVNRFVGVPVVAHGRIVAIVGLANKDEPYNDTDVLQLQLLADGVWRVVERQLVQDELAKVSAAVEQSTSLVEITDLEGNIEYVNPRFAEVTGYSLEEVRGKKPSILKSGNTPAATYADMWATISAGEVWRGEIQNRKKDGSLYWERVTISPIKNQDGVITHYLAIKDDVTTQKHLEAQFRQTQKMEAVGRLAGGIAHDFNNMLSVILGHTELALGQLEPSNPLWEDLDEIRKAAQRSADLTRQLLGFARSQPVKPVVMDTNEAVSRCLTMLRRLIGEDIDLLWKPGHEVRPIRIDPAQLDQILANLAVNARDAIEGVGSLTIETENVIIDRAYCAAHAGFVPGRYVLLAVSDSGHGIEPAVLEHIFEPFFTTKPAGQGTGLGLATVHGIVKQNSGFINVYSEVGRGTSFKICFPEVPAEDARQAVAREAEPRGGTETILIVEDEETILGLARSILERCGYTVLTVRSPGEALELVASTPEEIDLLITDVVMPGMNGKELATQLLQLRPALKVLFMSGYTANVIVHHGVLEPDVEFIQKPFSVTGLARRVREVLDARAAG